jgi:hypothetical protein
MTFDCLDYNFAEFNFRRARWLALVKSNESEATRIEMKSDRVFSRVLYQSDQLVFEKGQKWSYKNHSKNLHG